MPESSGQEIVRRAIQNNELDLLLSGAPEYQYLPKYTPAPGKTDLAALLDIVYGLVDEYPHGQVAASMICAINRLLPAYEGIEPVANCVLFEAGRRFDNAPLLGLPLQQIASELRSKISQHSSQLLLDNRGAGVLWEDGLLGELRHLSNITEQLGGPSFCD